MPNLFAFAGALLLIVGVVRGRWPVAVIGGVILVIAVM